MVQFRQARPVHEQRPQSPRAFLELEQCLGTIRHQQCVRKRVLAADPPALTIGHPNTMKSLSSVSAAVHSPRLTSDVHCASASNGATTNCPLHMSVTDRRSITNPTSDPGTPTAPIRWPMIAGRSCTGLARQDRNFCKLSAFTLLTHRDSVTYRPTRNCSASHSLSAHLSRLNFVNSLAGCGWPSNTIIGGSARASFTDSMRLTKALLTLAISCGDSAGVSPRATLARSSSTASAFAALRSCWKTARCRLRRNHDTGSCQKRRVPQQTAAAANQRSQHVLY